MMNTNMITHKFHLYQMICMINLLDKLSILFQIKNGIMILNLIMIKDFIIKIYYIIYKNLVLKIKVIKKYH